MRPLAQAPSERRAPDRIPDPRRLDNGEIEAVDRVAPAPGRPGTGSIVDPGHRPSKRVRADGDSDPDEGSECSTVADAVHEKHPGDHEPRHLVGHTALPTTLRTPTESTESELCLLAAHHDVVPRGRSGGAFIVSGVASDRQRS